MPYAGICLHGELVSQRERAQDDHCGRCDPGYQLKDKQCDPYGGKCVNGNLVFPQNKRTADDQCGSCNAGYELQISQVRTLCCIAGWEVDRIGTRCYISSRWKFLVANAPVWLC